MAPALAVRAISNSETSRSQHDAISTSDHLNEQLRGWRRGARDEFVDAVADSIPRTTVRNSARVRTGLALALTIAASGATSAFGGVGCAKSAFHQVTGTVHAAVVHPAHVTVRHSITPADGQVLPR